MKTRSDKSGLYVVSSIDQVKLPTVLQRLAGIIKMWPYDMIRKFLFFMQHVNSMSNVRFFNLCSISVNSVGQGITFSVLGRSTPMYS